MRPLGMRNPRHRLLFVPSVVLLSAVVMVGCAMSPQPGVRSTPTEVTVGDYTFSGRVNGLRVGGSVRFDSAGTATLVSRVSSAASVMCTTQPNVQDDQLWLACGGVALRLALVDSGVAPSGTIAFPGPARVRRQFDPFFCSTDRDGNCGALGREVTTTSSRWFSGKVAVQRADAEE